MTAGAGECNGRSEGSKVEFEVKGGGDVKDNGGGGIACVGDGVEIGGSFVIVNGGDSDWSDLDPATKSENGETEEIVGKEEPSPLESEKNGNFFGVRWNGDEAGEEKNVMMGPGSVAEAEYKGYGGVIGVAVDRMKLVSESGANLLKVVNVWIVLLKETNLQIRVTTKKPAMSKFKLLK